MPTSQPAAEPEPQAARERVVLYYTGDPETQYVSGVPADDLTEHDVARLVYVSTVQDGKPGLGPDDGGFDKARDAKVEELARLPFYRKTAPSKES